VLSSRDNCDFRELGLIQKTIISEIQRDIIEYDFRMIDEAETMIKNMVWVIVNVI
jgi:hypothetical protein